MIPLVALVAGLAPSGRTGPRTTVTATSTLGRRAAVAGAAAGAAASLLTALPSHALITGSKPPEGGMKAKKERKCKSIDECEALGDQTRAKAEEGQDLSFERTGGGDRYRDLTVGDGPAAKDGDAVEIRYRVMRLGTKARDGLSGEGQTIFSFGYGEDEDTTGAKLPVVLKGENLVAGVNDAILGMKPGGRRRVLVRPERGWKIQTGTCAEGEKKIDIDGAATRTSTQEGNLVFRADIGAAIENEGACMSKTRLPQPRTYGQRQRFTRRFDESLMVELDLVAFTSAEAAASGGGGGGGGATYVYNKCEANPFADGCEAN